MSDNMYSSVYVKELEKQISEFNKIIVSLKAQISILRDDIAHHEKIPIPKSVIRQIIELEAENRKLKEEVEYYKKHVSNEIIINREHKHNPNNRKGGIPK